MVAKLLLKRNYLLKDNVIANAAYGSLGEICLFRFSNGDGISLQNHE